MSQAEVRKKILRSVFDLIDTYLTTPDSEERGAEIALGVMEGCLMVIAGFFATLRRMGHDEADLLRLKASLLDEIDKLINIAERGEPV